MKGATQWPLCCKMDESRTLGKGIIVPFWGEKGACKIAPKMRRGGAEGASKKDHAMMRIVKRSHSLKNLRLVADE